MAQPVSKVRGKESETTNYPQGRTGSKVKMNSGPATGKGDLGQKGKGRSAFTKAKGKAV